MTPLLIAIVAAANVLAASSAGHDGTMVAPAARPAVIEAAPGTAPMQQPPKPAPLASISAEVMVLHGTNNNSGIDPKIGKMPALSKPPFSSYNSYRLLDQSKLALSRGAVSTLKLASGRDFEVVFKDVIEPQKKGEERRYVVTASIQKHNGKTDLPLVEVNAKAGEFFFVGGQSYQGGSLVIGIKVYP